MTKGECPAGCGAGQGEGLRYVSSSDLNFTPLVLAASRMQQQDQLLLCHACGRVVRRSFDTYLLRFRLHTLGTYDRQRGLFEPGSWLQREMDRLSMPFGPNLVDRRGDSEGE
jgi:hypothetical protein